MTAEAVRPPPPSSTAVQLGWVAVAEALAPAECARLVTVMETALTVQAGDGGALARGRRDAGVRRADVVWLNDGPRTGWVMMRLADLAARANREHYGFALDGFDEALQLTRYPAEVAGFYDWHVDRGATGLTARRKLSISIQLSPPESYEDGALELNVDGHVVAAPRALGTAILFPSFALHRVAPVTAGVRHALVTWIHGPDFV